MSLGTRPGEAESLVGPELAENAVASGAEGDGQDEADGEELDGDLLEGTDALGDGVGWVIAVLVVLFGCCFFRATDTNRSAPPSAIGVSIGISLLSCFLRYERWRETSSWAWTGGAGPSRAAGRGRRGRRAA